MTARQRGMAWGVGVVVFIALVFVLRDVLLPFVIGMAIAYFLDPACDKLEALGCSRMIATTLITAVFFVLMAGAVVLLAPPLSTQILAFIKKLPSYAATLRDYALQFARVVERRTTAEDMQKLQEILDGVSERALGYLAGLAESVFSGFGGLFTVLSLALITPVVTFYLLRDWDRIIGKIDSWLPRGNADVIREQVRLIDQTLAGFARGQALVCVLLGVFYAIGLSVVGLEFGLIVGFVTGLISFVPYFGMIVGFVAGVGIAIGQFGELVPVLLVALVFGIGQVLEGNPRRGDALRPGKGERAGAVRPYRIGEDVEPGGLDQHGGMADHGDAQAVALDARFRTGRRERALDHPGPGCLLAAEFPSEQVGNPLWLRAVGIEEPHPVEMIAGRA